MISLPKLTILLLLLIVYADFIVAQIAQDLKPCFERYIGEKLASIYPYHSEWRMKTAESCLEFCAASSSRCKSIVYEKHEHICHYFMEDGSENVIPSMSSIYFKVTAKECLDRASKLANTPSSLENSTQSAVTTAEIDAEESDTTTPPLIILNKTYNKTIVQPAPGREQILKLLSETAADSDYVTNTAESNNGDTKAESQESSTKNKKTSNNFMVNNKTVKEEEVRIPSFTNDAVVVDDFDDEAIFTIPPTTTIHTADTIQPVVPSKQTDVIQLTKIFKHKASGRTGSEDGLANYLQDFMKLYKQNINIDVRRHPSKSDVLRKGITPQDQSNRSTEVEISDYAVPPRAQKISLLDKEIVKSLEESKEGDISLSRAPQTIIETEDEKETENNIADSYLPSYLPKARSFLASVNEQKASDDSKDKASVADESEDKSDADVPLPTIKLISMKMTQKEEETFQPLPACRNDESAVWLTVENAMLGVRSLQKRTNAESADACKSKCNLITNAGRDCPAFTYDEAEHECILFTSDSEAVERLIFTKSKSEDFTVRTATKFCYPESLEIFKNCSEFTAFRDFTLDLVPREEFDGMPKDKSGLHACLELCVLSPNYYCKSATFLINEGICRLNEETSLTKPGDFRESTDKEIIYFENGCEQYDADSEGNADTVKATNIKRVPATPSLKSLRIKPMHVAQTFQNNAAPAMAPIPIYGDS